MSSIRHKGLSDAAGCDTFTRIDGGLLGRGPSGRSCGVRSAAPTHFRDRRAQGLQRGPAATGLHHLIRHRGRCCDAQPLLCGLHQAVVLFGAAGVNLCGHAARSCCLARRSADHSNFLGCSGSGQLDAGMPSFASISSARSRDGERRPASIWLAYCTEQSAAAARTLGFTVIETSAMAHVSTLFTHCPAICKRSV